MSRATAREEAERAEDGADGERRRGGDSPIAQLSALAYHAAWARPCDGIFPDTADWIGRQRIFFVATTPLAAVAPQARDGSVTV